MGPPQIRRRSAATRVLQNGNHTCIIINNRKPAHTNTYTHTRNYTKSKLYKTHYTTENTIQKQIRRIQNDCDL